MLEIGAGTDSEIEFSGDCGGDSSFDASEPSLCKFIPFIDSLAGSSMKGQMNLRHLSNKSLQFNLLDTSKAESPFSSESRARPRYK